MEWVSIAEDGADVDCTFPGRGRATLLVFLEWKRRIHICAVSLLLLPQPRLYVLLINLPKRPQTH